jgi:hypothetical protein
MNLLTLWSPIGIYRKIQAGLNAPAGAVREHSPVITG